MSLIFTRSPGYEAWTSKCSCKEHAGKVNLVFRDSKGKFKEEINLDLEDFLSWVQYVLTNTELRYGDPRRLFIWWAQMLRVKGNKVVEGERPKLLLRGRVEAKR
jgi:hypothetical protein